MLVRLLLDCSLGRRGAEVVVGEADALRLTRKGRAVVVSAPAPAPEEVPEPEALVVEPAAPPPEA